MAKKRLNKEDRKTGNKNPLLYGIVLLVAGALVGSVISTAIQTTSRQTEVLAQQDDGMTAQIKVFTDRVALNPKDGNAWVTLGNLYFDTHQYEKSIAAYARGLEINPGNPNVLTDKGVMHRAVGEFQQALDCFAQAIAANPSHETARMNTGVVLLYDLGDKEGAIKAWQELVRINPQAVNAQGRSVADMLRELGAAAPGVAAPGVAVPGSAPRLLAPGSGS